MAATLTSIVLASVAMLPVLRTATGDDGGLLSADQLRRSGAGNPLPLPSVPSTSPTSATPAAEPDDEAEPTGEPSPSRTSKPPRTTPPTKTTSPTSAPPAAESRVVDGWTVTTGGDGVETYVRSFRVDGGQAVIRIRDSKVGVVSATPSNGFEVATVQNSPENLAVYFNETNHSFIIHAVWNVNRPFAEVNEIGG
jgi:hypothetical protein